MALTIAAAKVVVAYLLGSFSGSLVLGKLRGVDIRAQGSGNAGGTNALRTQGVAFALVVVVIDIGKGALATALAWWPPHASWPAPMWLALACALACMLGHLYPVYFGFRGGKGAAVLLGAVAVLLPLALPPLLLLWLLVLGATGYVGLATVIAALAFTPVAWWLAAPADRVALTVFGVVIGVVIVITHRANLQRLRAGTEYRFERARFLARLWRPRGGSA